ncbi:cyclic di-AMP binding protein CbpA [Carnobacterium viridans]|uniref:CBS domain-containing protein n=1 Tax=Carnobacterium viridans TaxID=174587 RepID=A0A1H1AJD6_9LACT|nr:cyclic di-AMP binding protein CbpA [Carnobacterium viridans]UDE96167.1 cyclic di-AMP binding protein CbpA [Carnobacterium viridans]SDQ39750.1 CBS domain-containing protein [Carnobacterium viridans]
MLIKSLCIPKNKLTTVSETVTLQEAIDILEKSGFRCIPILDETGTIFRGNIYKMHIYRHKANGGDMNLPVTHLLKNATKFISIDASFFKVFFSIKELPYISVLDEDNRFYGILTHSSLLNMLQQSWNVNTGSYVLTIASTGQKGDLANMAKIISRFCSISSCITLDVEQDDLVRRTMITLESGMTKDTLKELTTTLSKKGFRVVEIEDLKNIG